MARHDLPPYPVSTPSINWDTGKRLTNQSKKIHIFINSDKKVILFLVTTFKIYFLNLYAQKMPAYVLQRFICRFLDCSGKDAKQHSLLVAGGIQMAPGLTTIVPGQILQ